MNSSINKNQSLLTMMPPQAQKQVLLLIKRLGDEKQIKQQLQKKCLNYEAEIKELYKQIQKIKKQNISLKAKWQNSFTMISKVRQNFSGSKQFPNQGSSKEKSIKKIKFNKQQANWTQQSQGESNQVQASQDGLKNKQNVRQNHSYGFNQRKDNQNYNFQHDNLNQKTKHNNLEYKQKHSCDTLPPMTNKKEKKNYSNQNQIQREKYFQNSSKQKLNIINGSRKKIQIECLKQQISQLTEQIKNKQTGNMSLNQKIKRCQQIKNRYKKPEEKNSIQQSRLNNQNLTILNSYYSPKKSELQQNYERNGRNQTVFNSIEKTSRSLINNDQKLFSQNKKQNKSQQNSNEQQINRNNYCSPDYSQDARDNIFKANVIVSQIQTGQTHRNTKKPMSKSLQQSFYDDGLLDLIQEINL